MLLLLPSPPRALVPAPGGPRPSRQEEEEEEEEEEEGPRRTGPRSFEPSLLPLLRPSTC
jgi:hypothetical protein